MELPGPRALIYDRRRVTWVNRHPSRVSVPNPCSARSRVAARSNASARGWSPAMTAASASSKETEEFLGRPLSCHRGVGRHQRGCRGGWITTRSEEHGMQAVSRAHHLRRPPQRERLIQAGPSALLVADMQARICL